ncbi:MAG: HD domain-containing protein [bacterium]|nr:HD domain-containing protein [bacterium]
MATALDLPATSAADFAAIPVSGLAASEPLAFPLYLRTAQNTWVLYRPATSALDATHVGRLNAEGVFELFIRKSDRGLYYQRVGSSLDRMLLERDVPIETRAEVLVGVATRMADELLASRPNREGVQKARKVMMATSGLLLREEEGFAAIRKMLSGSTALSKHALTVSFLSMGLARISLGSDAHGLMVAGLAGLLHDIGHIGHEGGDEDEMHTIRGAEYLAGLGLPDVVVEATLHHHERWDGSGGPHGLVGKAIPPLARVVGLVDTFDKVYSNQRPRVSVFDALRILALAYRDCFDNDLTAGFIKLFR